MVFFLFKPIMLLNIINLLIISPLKEIIQISMRKYSVIYKITKHNCTPPFWGLFFSHFCSSFLAWSIFGWPCVNSWLAAMESGLVVWKANGKATRVKNILEQKLQAVARGASSGISLQGDIFTRKYFGSYGVFVAVGGRDFGGEFSKIAGSSFLGGKQATQGVVLERKQSSWREEGCAVNHQERSPWARYVFVS